MNKVVVGLSFGDEGKGSMVDYLCRTTGADLVVRFNGGPQASHHVCQRDGRWHGFSQFGSGTFMGVPTYLSRFTVIEPYSLRNEADVLAMKGVRVPFSFLTVSADCLVVTPWHWKLNRMKELRRGGLRHGSCGMGVGEVRADELAGLDVIRARDLGNVNLLRHIRDRKVEQTKTLFGSLAEAVMADDTPDLVAQDHGEIREHIFITDGVPPTPRVDQYYENIVFEGAQGVLLDETYGWAPYNTWTNTTADNALTLAKEMGHEKPVVIGLVPAMMTRHGAGPFVTEVKEYFHPEPHNKRNDWQGSVRHGVLDIPAIRYAMRHCEVDELALTMFDKIGGFPFNVCTEYGRPADSWVDRLTDIPDGTTAEQLFRMEPALKTVHSLEQLEAMLYGKPIRWISNGPTHLDKVHIEKRVTA